MPYVHLAHGARPLGVAPRDFNFRNPTLPLDGRAMDAGDVAPLLEQSHFAPGAFRVVDVDVPTFTPIADLLSNQAATGNSIALSCCVVTSSV